MTYFAQHTQTGETTNHFTTPYLPLMEAEDLGWEESETELMEGDNGNGWPAEYPCAYTFHYGDETYTCELTANRPDSLCPFHTGEED